MNPQGKIDAYFTSEHPFKSGIVKLREIILTTELEETFKWSQPVYAIQGKNVLSVSKFKNHFGIWFFNGVFLSDPENVLVNAQEKTKAMRNWKFTSTEDINSNIVLSYIKEAIYNQKKGLVVTPQKSKNKSKSLEIHEVLKSALENNAKLKAAFTLFTLFKQKEFSEYISTAKQEKTKQNRLQKIIPMILNNTGLNDKYRNC